VIPSASQEQAGPGNEHLSLLERDADVIGRVGKLRFSPLVAVRGEGSVLIDEDGRRLLDMSMCGGAAIIGYGHPAVARAVAEASRDMAGASLLLHPNRPAVELAERLLSSFQNGTRRKVWFGHSGSDANDTAVRVIQAATGRNRFISFIGSYHGGLGGSMAVSGHTAMTHTLARAGLVLLPYPDPYRGEFDTDDVLRLLDLHLATVAPADQVAAIIVEPLMSDGGLIVPPDGFLTGLRKRCDAHGILLMVDEVKVGLGRTGFFHAFEAHGVAPDVVTFGKGLGGGLPLSCVVADADLMDAAPAFAILTTSGNPVAASAGLAVLDTIETEGLVDRARRLGGALLRDLRQLADSHAEIGDVRGSGLAVGIDLVTDRETRQPVDVMTTAKVIYRCYELGLHLIYVGLAANVLELTPSLMLSDEDAMSAVSIIDQALKDVAHGRVSDEKVRPYMMW
jgi:4-aminobutyrate aminotransferase